MLVYFQFGSQRLYSYHSVSDFLMVTQKSMVCRYSLGANVNAIRCHSSAHGFRSYPCLIFWLDHCKSSSRHLLSKVSSRSDLVRYWWKLKAHLFVYFNLCFDFVNRCSLWVHECRLMGKKRHLKRFLGSYFLGFFVFVYVWQRKS